MKRIRWGLCGSRMAAFLSAFLLAACGSLPPKPVHPVSHALTAGDTPLAKIARESLPPEQPSGFRLLPQADHALEARMELIARAERTLDVQYYFIAGDTTGKAFLQALSQAAARGVQVRLLIDDLHTAEIDSILRALARQSNFELRLFNPFCCARSGLVSRFLSSLGEVRRLNHRMHNKLMVADQALAVAGGRNIADEYFASSPEQEFVDMDALMAGAVVDQMTAIFVRYWESDPVWSALSVLGISDTSTPQAEPSVLPSGALELEEVAEDVLGQASPSAELSKGRLTLVPGSAYAFADSPSKVLLDDEEYLLTASAISRVREAMAGAKSELAVATPYLIPRERGMALIRHLADNGVRVTVLTNSMAANDSIFAHAGYARYRRGMLKAGVELYELSPARAGAPKRVRGGMRAVRSLGRLHTKAVVIDRTSVYIGSVNLDPRSADKNTEFGMWIESPALARQMLEVLDANRRLGAYRVQLAPGTEALQWVAWDEHGVESVLSVEPESTPLMRLQNLLIGPLVPESLL
jgi:putative cardiolipin synthase